VQPLEYTKEQQVAINGAQNMLIAEEAIRFMTELRDQV
jgi:hypothetical protein